MHEEKEQLTAPNICNAPIQSLPGNNNLGEGVSTWKIDPFLQDKSSRKLHPEMMRVFPLRIPHQCSHWVLSSQ